MDEYAQRNWDRLGAQGTMTLVLPSYKHGKSTEIFLKNFSSSLMGLS